MSTLRQLAAAHGLRRLLGAWTLVTLAEWAFVTALAVHAFQEAGAFAVGIVGFRFVPAALAQLAVGPLVDRHAGGRLLTAVAAVRAATVAAGALALAVGAPLAVVLGLVALDAVLATPYRPAQAALIPTLARTPGEVSAAVTGLSTVKTIGQAMGALLGGVVVAAASPAAVAAGAGGLLLLAAALTSQLPASPRALVYARHVAAAGESLRAAPVLLMDALAGPIAWASGLRSLIRGLWFSLAVVTALELLDLGDAGVGVLMAAAGIGAVAAVPLSFALAGRLRLAGAASVGLTLCGLPLVVTGLIPETGVALVAVAVWGAGMAVADVATLALLHRLVDAHRLGRTVSAMESFKLALEGAGALMAPALVAAFGIEATLVAAGLPLPLFVIAAAGRLRAADAAAADRTALVALLRRVDVFRPLSIDGLEDVASRVIRSTAAVGDEIVRQGDPGHCMYVIETGTAEVLVGGYRIATLGPGQGFGERALLRDAPRAATVRADAPLVLHALDRGDFLAATTSRGFVREGPALAVLDPAGAFDGVSLLAHLPPAARRHLAEQAEVRNWTRGDTVVRQGERSDSLHVVLSGVLVVTVAGRSAGDLLPGDSFGEIALIHGTSRMATVMVAGATAVTASLARDILAGHEALPA